MVGGGGAGELSLWPRVLLKTGSLFLVFASREQVSERPGLQPPWPTPLRNHSGAIPRTLTRETHTLLILTPVVLQEGEENPKQGREAGLGGALGEEFPSWALLTLSIVPFPHPPHGSGPVPLPSSEASSPRTERQEYGHKTPNALGWAPG